MTIFNLAYIMRSSQRLAHLGLLHCCHYPRLHSGTLLQQEGMGNPEGTVLVSKGRDLADRTYKVKRQRTVWLHVHLVEAHREGMGLVSSGSKGHHVFIIALWVIFLKDIGYFFLRLTALKET